MDLKIKVVVAVLPFGIAIAVGSTLAYPAFNDYSAKAAQVEEKKKEQEELESKLSSKDKVKKEKIALENSIQALRESVPKKADVELLNIDLEKMCLESGVELVSFKTPSSEELKKAGLDDTESESAKNKSALASKVKGATAPITGPAGAAAAGGATPPAAGAKDAGLSKFTMQLKVIGDYAGIMHLAQKLEAYQRVVAISELTTSVPKKSDTNKGELADDAVITDTDEPGDYTKLNGSMMLTAYYLP